MTNVVRQLDPKALGLTKRDVARIKALAESVTPNNQPAALADLDAPWRIAACPAGEESRFSGRVIGQWAGRVLLAWPKG